MPRHICDRCGDTIPPHAHYVVKMQVYADPSLPPVTSDDLEETDYTRRIADLLKQMESLTPDQLEQSVHWQAEFRICRPCQQTLIQNPLNSPPPTRAD
jgi:hypothetical protein